MPTNYSKEDNYTLRVTNDVPGGGQLCRYFNFAAQQVTVIYRERAELKDDKSAGYSNPSVSTSVSVALTSQMQVQKFSELDTLGEVELMRAELIKRGGTPPEIGDRLNKPAVAKLG